MVHALEESWRVLTPDGVLVDTRPLSGDVRLDVIADSGTKFAGFVDDSSSIPYDEASDQALETALGKGLFLKEEETDFIFADYWDTLEQLRSYTEENWEMTHIPEKVWHKAEDLVSQSEGAVQIRISDKNLFTRYRKQVLQT
jgi:hypothetical protein